MDHDIPASKEIMIPMLKLLVVAEAGSCDSRIGRGGVSRLDLDIAFGR